MKYLSALLCIFYCLQSFAALPEGGEGGVKTGYLFQAPPDTTKQWATPSVIGDRPGKGIKISYNLVSPFNIVSVPVTDGLQGASGRVTRLEQMEYTLRIPITWKGRTKIFTSLEYLYEEYHFENYEGLKYNFYTNLEDKHLNSMRLVTYVVHALDSRRFLGSRIGLEINGDYRNNPLPFRQKSKASVALLYGWKQDPYTIYGFGGYYSYSWGRPSVYPVFLWNKTINRRWGIESVLPSNFRLRYTFSPNTFLLGGGRVEGYSYHIVLDEPPLSTYPNLELRSSNLFAFLELEQKIYKLVWFGFTAGFRYNVNFNIAEENTFNNQRIIENTLGHSPYFNISLFLVAPGKRLNPPLPPDNPAP